jgi:bridging integrator 3
VLIHFRVPYLDPSFEALVKIQLRFCAEAYSRMAQVQQYVSRIPVTALSMYGAYMVGI